MCSSDLTVGRNLKGAISVAVSAAKLVVKVPDGEEFSLSVRIDGPAREQILSAESSVNSIYK